MRQAPARCGSIPATCNSEQHGERYSAQALPGYPPGSGPLETTRLVGCSLDLDLPGNPFGSDRSLDQALPGNSFGSGPKSTDMKSNFVQAENLGPLVCPVIERTRRAISIEISAKLIFRALPLRSLSVRPSMPLVKLRPRPINMETLANMICQTPSLSLPAILVCKIAASRHSKKLRSIPARETMMFVCFPLFLPRATIAFCFSKRGNSSGHSGITDFSGGCSLPPLHQGPRIERSSVHTNIQSHGPLNLDVILNWLRKTTVQFQPACSLKS